MSDRPETLIDALRETAARHGDARGFTFYDAPARSAVVGYAELDLRARRIAAALAAEGLLAGQVVVLAIEPGLSFIETFYGASYAGLVVAPLALGGMAAVTPPPALGRIVRAVAASAVLASDRLLDTYSVEGARSDVGVPILRAADLLAGDEDAWVRPDLASDAPAALVFTSGSTGEPKGVTMTHAGTVAGCAAAGGHVEFDETSIYVGWAPLHHSMGLMWQVVMPVLFGYDCVLAATEQFQRRPLLWLQLMSRHRATHSIAGNFAFDVCAQLVTDAQLAELDLSSLRALMTGSEPVRLDTVARFVERFGAHGIRRELIMPVLGSSEAMVLTAKPQGRDLDLVAFDADSFERGVLRPASGGREQRMISCGVPLEGSTLVIVDPESGEQLPDSAVGEIWFAGPSVSPGYWRNPEATASVFGARVPGRDESFLRTGDLGALIDGRLFITGRAKEVLVFRGRKIYPQDLEAAATRVHPAIGIGTAFELPSAEFEPAIVLELELGRGPAPDPDGLADEVRRALVAEFSLPSLEVVFVSVGQVPRTASGKVRRAEARLALERGDLDVLRASGASAASTR